MLRYYSSDVIRERLEIVVRSGWETPIRRFTVVVDDAGTLRATDAADVRVLVKRVRDDEWIDLGENPISLNSETDGKEVDFDLKINASKLENFESAVLYVKFFPE